MDCASAASGPSPPTVKDRLSRRRFLAWPAALGAAAAGRAAAAPAVHEGLPLAASLRDELGAALRQAQPLVVLVSLDGCPFCRAVRQSYLAPMHGEGLPVVQVDWRSPRPLADFTGAASTHDAMVAAWKVKVAPTVLFFGPGGREVAERLRGASVPDFYGAYLEARLATARKALAPARG